MGTIWYCHVAVHAVCSCFGCESRAWLLILVLVGTVEMMKENATLKLKIAKSFSAGLPPQTPPKHTEMSDVTSAWAP